MVFMLRPLGRSGVEQRPDGATTQEVYNMARQIKTYLIIKQEVGVGKARASSHPEDEDKCLEKGLRQNGRSVPQRFQAIKPLILLANITERFYWPTLYVVNYSHVNILKKCSCSKK